MVFSRVILLNYGIGGQFASLLFKYQVQELNFTIKNLWKDKEWYMIFSGMNLVILKGYSFLLRHCGTSEGGGNHDPKFLFLIISWH